MFPIILLIPKRNYSLTHAGLSIVVQHGAHCTGAYVPTISVDTSTAAPMCA
jgi:hypothetical protein